MNQRFDWAAIAIFAAMVLDGMDGRVARLTNTQSAFGEQFDSLSDMTSFGVAPALVMYEWILNDLGRWGWAGAYHTTYWVDPEHELVGVMMAQLMPATGSTLLSRFRTLVYAMLK